VTIRQYPNLVNFTETFLNGALLTHTMVPWTPTIGAPEELPSRETVTLLRMKALDSTPVFKDLPVEVLEILVMGFLKPRFQRYYPQPDLRIETGCDTWTVAVLPSDGTLIMGGNNYFAHCSAVGGQLDEVDFFKSREVRGTCVNRDDESVLVSSEDSVFKFTRNQDGKWTNSGAVAGGNGKGASTSRGAERERSLPEGMDGALRSLSGPTTSA